MNFLVKKDDLKKELSIVSKAIKPNSPLSYMECIKFESKDGKLTMTAMSEDSVFISSLECEQFFDEKTFLIESKVINSIVSKLNGDLFELSLEDGKNLADIKCGKSKFKVNVLDATKFPDKPQVDDEEPFTVTSAMLEDIVKKIGISTSQNNLRPVLSGINFNCINNDLTAAATDSYRLSMKNYECGRVKFFNATIPFVSLKDSLKLFDGNVTVTINDKMVCFEQDNHSCYIRLLDGEYPNVKRLIPASFEGKIKFDLKEFREIVERSMFVKNDSGYYVDIKTDKNVMNIASGALEVGSFAETMDVDVDGSDLTISCDANYLLQALNSFDLGDDITMNYNGELKPMLFKSDNLIQLVLPIRRAK